MIVRLISGIDASLIDEFEKDFPDYPRVAKWNGRLFWLSGFWDNGEYDSGVIYEETDVLDLGCKKEFLPHVVIEHSEAKTLITADQPVRVMFNGGECEIDMDYKKVSVLFNDPQSPE